MNAERLHAISIAVVNDIDSTGSETILERLLQGLRGLVAEPQAAQYQGQVGEHMQSLRTALEAAPSNGFGPAWNQALSELGILDLLGNHLTFQIRRVLERNQITPSVALAEIEAIHNRLSSLRASLTQLSASFQLLNVGAERLEPGQCEVGIFVPPDFAHNQLKEFANDLNEIDELFGVFSELATGERPGLQIRSISSGDLNVVMEMQPAAAAAIAVTVEQVIAMYQQVIEIRNLHGQLKKQGLSDKELESVTSHANKAMRSGIDKLVVHLLKDYSHIREVGGRADLATELGNAVAKIANRIDQGYSIEVRVAPRAGRTHSEEKRKPDHEDAKHEDTILSASRNQQFLKLDGERILTLPESVPKRTRAQQFRV